MIKILLGGSPCTYWSIAKAATEKRETTASGVGWELFNNYLIAKDKFKPDIFLYENNKSAANAIKQQIRAELSVYDGTFLTRDTGARYIEINSALVSAQHRERFYIHNCGDVDLPPDRGIMLRDILDGDIAATTPDTPCGTRQTDKARCLRAAYSHAGQRDFIKDITTNGQLGATGIIELATQDETRPTYKVKNKKILLNGDEYPINLADGLYIFRKMSVAECCRLQTLPDNYCRAVSNNQAYKGLGNGWTAEVIIHILANALKGVPQSEKIVVLSMYDGIATGRYCLDKLGFNNIEYHAYEIDKYAIKVAQSNFADIKQHGDAFALRSNDWDISGATQVDPPGEYGGDNCGGGYK